MLDSDIKQSEALITQQRFDEALVRLSPWIEKNSTEALLLRAEIYMKKSPKQGLTYLMELANSGNSEANYRLAFITYFHPEVGQDFRTYLYQAWKSKHVDACLAIINLYIQQGDHTSADNIAYLSKNLHSIFSNLAEHAKPSSIYEPKHFLDIKRPDLSKLRYTQIAPEINLYTIDNFLTDFESEWLIYRSKKSLAKAEVVNGESGSSIVNNARTGSVAQLKPDYSDWILFNIEMKLSAYFNIPIQHGEITNVLNYQVNEEYKPHYDFFHPNDPGSNIAKEDGGQRFKTALIYLNDVKEGGETSFPRLKKTLNPKKNQLVIFNNTDNSFNPLPASLHQSISVTHGEKWVLSKWFRQKATSYNEYLRKCNVI